MRITPLVNNAPGLTMEALYTHQEQVNYHRFASHGDVPDRLQSNPSHPPTGKTQKKGFSENLFTTFISK